MGLERLLSMEPLTPCPYMADPETDLTAIVLRERSRLGSFIRRRVRDQIDAEDILQDVLFAFVEAFRLPTPIEHASAWLFQVARNRIIDRFRRKKEERIPEAVDGDEEGDSRLDLVFPALDAGPEAEYARSALLGALQDAIDELPDDQRAVFIAHELEGKSFRDLSLESGVNVNTLLARKRYAIAFLRRRLRAAYDELDI
jgi:RNA polymerase sigma factor (sigma-70 family)